MKAKVPPPIREIQNWDLRAEPQNMWIKYLDTYKWDFDIYLPTRGINLQRPLVWTDKQKGELIYSIYSQRYIPAIYLICPWTTDMTFEVLDGKQRLNAMMGFLKDEFPVVINGESFLFSELPSDYQRFYQSYGPQFRVIFEGNTPFTDDQKIRWFGLINFAGTPQDEEHMKLLTSKSPHSSNRLGEIGMMG